MAVIDCKNVSIRYITGDLKAIGMKEYLVRRMQGRYRVKEFWADKDITFALERGDMLGIVGTNGAGKSTLLKAITGIMRPDRGKMKVSGRVAALLELSSGFDQEMTVRENTYLRGAMLGYTKKFLDEMYDEIIRFAELEEFQNYKFKQLSSGMKSRLAFSIACLVEPDILILDEVLSVGDGAFRKKSGAKMAEILQSGITGILVSHSVAQVRELCNKILWIDHGRQITFSDDPTLTLDAYEEFLLTKKLPKDQAEIEELAKAFRKRKVKEQKAKAKRHQEHLEEALKKKGSKDAVEAALTILRENRPDLLAEYVPAEGQEAQKAPAVPAVPAAPEAAEAAEVPAAEPEKQL